MLVGRSIVIVEPSSSEVLVPEAPAGTYGKAASAIWTANMRARRMMVEMRTGKSRPMKEHPPDFTGYRVKTSSESLFWQGLFIMAIRVHRNKLLQPFILGNFYANGVPKSAIHVFARYFMLLKCNFAPVRAAKFCSSTDKMGNNERKWSLE
jgi:hypothetical protein